MIKPDITFALMTSFHKHGKSLYSSFLPLVLDCIQKNGSELIAINEVQKTYRNNYGIELPQSVIKKILIVGKSNGYITIEKEIIKATDKINEINILEAQKNYIIAHEYIINNFISYIKALRNIELTSDEAENAMREFMEENIYKLIKNSIEKNNFAIKTSGNDLKIAFGQYLRKSIETPSEILLKYISDIAKGLMIQNAVYLPSDDKLQQKFSNTYLILDTPLVLSLLGYAGKMFEKPIREFLDIALKSKAKLGIFDFTIDEVMSILKDCSDRIKNNSTNTHGRTYEYFIEKNYSYEQIIIFMNRLENDIRKNNIDIIKKPKYFDEYLIDENELESFIDKHIQYKNQGAKQKDINSIATTYNLRAGNNPMYIEYAGFIFITSNYGLVRAAKEYFHNKKLHVDIVMTDFFITNILWVKNPIKFPDLPLKIIIADIYSALQPSDAIWNAFITKVDSMKEMEELTYSDVIALRAAYNIHDTLFELEANGLTEFTPTSIKEILDKINNDKEEDFKQKELTKLQEKSEKVAKVTTNILSIIVFIVVLLYNISQFYQPIKEQLKENIFTMYNICSFFILLLATFNLVFGTNINIFKQKIEKFIKKFIFYLLKKIIE